MSNHLEERRLPGGLLVLYFIANRKLVFKLPLARRLLPRVCPISVGGGVDSEFAFCGASFGLDTTPDDLAVRVLRNPVAGAPSGSVILGSGRSSANALWPDAKCSGDRGQCWNHASRRNAANTSTGEPGVASRYVGNAPGISRRPGVAGTV